MPELLSITPTESVEIISSGPDSLEARGIYAGGGKPRPKHHHPFQAEQIEIISGTWLTTPPGRTEQRFRAIDAARGEGKVGKDGTPGPLAFGVYLTEYRDVFRLAGPDWLLRPGLAALAAIGRAGGYRA